MSFNSIKCWKLQDCIPMVSFYVGRMFRIFLFPPTKKKCSTEGEHWGLSETWQVGGLFYDPVPWFVKVKAAD